MIESDSSGGLPERPSPGPEPPPPSDLVIRVVLLLLGIMVTAGVLVMTAIAMRCLFWWSDPACSRNWGARQWVMDMTAVLIALMAGRRRP